MEFTSLSVVITASDETNDLKETVETLLAVGDDVGEIIVVLPDWASEGCVSTTNALCAAHPEKVRALVQTRKGIGGAILDGFDSACGSHLLYAVAAQVFLKVLYQSSIRDHTNPMQIMPAAFYRSIAWHERTYPLLEELVLVPLRLRVPFREVPCTCFGRREGESKNSFLQTALYLKTALRTRFVPKKKLFKENPAK